MARSYKRDKIGRFASGGGGGKSVRQTVQAKRSIGNNKTQKARISGKIPIDMSTGKKLPGELSGNTTRRVKPAGNAKFNAGNSLPVRTANANRSRRSNESTVVNSGGSGSVSARKLTGSSRSLNKTPLSAGKKPKKDTFARIPDLKSDPSADARIRAKAAERKAAEKARSDRSAADVKKYRMVGYRF